MDPFQIINEYMIILYIYKKKNELKTSFWYTNTWIAKNKLNETKKRKYFLNG